MVLETLQLTYYILHPKYDFLWDSPILTVGQSILKFIQISHLIEQESYTIYTSLLLFSIGVVIAILGLNIYVSTQDNSNSISLKILSVYAIFITTILYIPIANVFIAGIYCNQRTHGLECLDGQVYLFLVISIIGMILLSLQMFLYNNLYVDLNPFSSFPNASLPSKIPVLKLALKNFLPFYVLFDSELELGKPVTIFLLIIFTIIVIMRIRVPAYYKRDTLNCVVLCEGMLVWVTICTTIQAFIEKTGEEEDIMSMTYFIIGIPLFNFAIVSSLLTQRENQVLQTDPNVFYKPDEIRVYVNIFIKSIEEQMVDRKVQVKIMGILKEHQDKCISKLCACKNMSPAQMKKDGQNENRRQWYLIMKNILLMYLEKNSKCPDIILLSSYIHFERLNLKYKALTDLMKLEELNPDLQVSYCMYYQKYYIENDIKINDERNESNNTMDVNSIVLFQNQFVKFKDAIDVSLEMHFEFWTELMEPKIDIFKLNLLGEKIQSSVNFSAQEYKKLLKINSSNLMTMEMYAYYMKQVVNNEDLADKLLVKLAYAQRANINLLQNNKSQGGTTTKESNDKSKENNNTCVITISANLKQFGIIQNSNYDLMRMLAFKRSEVVGSNINVLMPKLFSDNHDAVLNNYIEKSDVINLGQKRIVIPMNKDGFGVPSELVVKVLPNLEDGMQLVGFLTELKPYFCPPYVNEDYEERYTQHFIAFDKKSLTITTCTYSCYQYFGIPKALINGNSSAANSFTLDLIIPDIVEPEIIEDLQKDYSNLLFDTTIIGTQFMISQESKNSQIQINNKDNQNEDDDGEVNIFLNKTNLDQTNNGLLNQTNQNDISVLPPVDNHNFQDQTNNQQQKQAQNNQNILLNPQSQNINQTINQTQQNEEEIYNQQINHLFEEYLEQKYKKTTIRAKIIQTTMGQYILQFEDTEEPIRKDINDAENNFQSQNQNDNDQLISKITMQRKQNDGIYDEEEQFLQQQNENDQEEENQQEAQLESAKSQTKSKTKSRSKGKSLGTSTLDEISQEQRYIKDLQYSLSSKTSSYTVKILKRVSFLLYIIFVVILSYQFIQKLQLRSNLQNSIQAIYVANNRHTVMPDTNFFVRQVFMQANNYYTYNNEQEKNSHKDKIQAILKDKVQMLHEIQFEVLEQIQIIEGFYSDPIEQVNFEYSFQMPNGNIFKDSYSITDGMLLMIAAATSISNTQLEFLQLSEIMSHYNDDLRYLYFIIENSMTDLRYGSELFSQELQRIYYNYVNEFESPNLLLMILNLIITITFSIVLIPLIFKTQNQNNELLGVFALIPIQEITYFVNQCNLFRTNYLIERTIDQIIKDKKKENDKELVEIQKEEDKINKQFDKLRKQTDQKQITNSTTTDPTNSISASPENKPTEGLLTQNDQLLLDNNNPQDNQQIQTIKEAQKQDEDEDEQQSRTERIINSETNNKSQIFIKFGVLTLLFIVYFITDNILETTFLSDVQLCIDHTQMMAARPSHIKYALVFALEEIITEQQVWYDGSELLYLYSKKIYDNELGVENSYKNSYPGSFDTYIEMFEQYNYGDVCEDAMWEKLKQEQAGLYGADEAYDFPEKCKLLQGGVLQKGISQSIKTIYENVRTFITDWRETTKRGITQPLKIEYLNSQVFLELVELQDFLLPVLYKMLDNFKEMYQDFIVSSTTLQQITFSIIIVIITFFFAFIWTPYVFKIGSTTQRIKGMLNMLPISLILNNKDLKNVFQKDGILQYFK